ncbi:hypothetical protein NQ317_018951 [Molorchus minor]|uniref:DNA-directed DNA polymerase n=1 Tax=Molorchus minor TaxID=1323400 RepID=A0ABQ9IU38_9CUCU|nr:hypothetical protein NQ317_018951 [Molorchus minor]
MENRYGCALAGGLLKHPVFYLCVGSRCEVINRGCDSLRHGIITINNKDNLCLPRAIVVAIAYASNDVEKNKVRRDQGKLQTQRVFQLLKDANLIIPEEGGGIPEIASLQHYFKDKYQIMVFKYGTKGRELIFKGPEAPVKISLLHHEGHYNQLLPVVIIVKPVVYPITTKMHTNVREDVFAVIGHHLVKTKRNMALSKLPKAFGLTELKKGYFPHLFNTAENENYVGNLPDVKYYSPDTMRSEDRTKFLEWYDSHKNDEFNMQKDIVEYCISDVNILTQACIKFRNLFIMDSNVCPFTEAITLPGACNKVYRRNFLKPNTIGIIPKNGYRWRNNQSKIATQWLIWTEKQLGINIIHTAKEKEITLSGFNVDGYCKSTKQVFEFHEKNPALRQVGKDVITSFWGRMGLRENQSKTTIINSNPALFFQMMTDPAIFINNVLPINDKTLIVNWEFRDESYEILPTVNVCLAAYTTTLARLKLYSYLEKLGNRVLYHDTDSVVYISQENDNIDIPLGSMLGEMTNELECYGPNSYITKFVSGGPKLYAYVVHSPSNNEYTEVCKVKGICINHAVSKDVNFNKMRDMILQNDPPVYITSQNIRRSNTYEVFTKQETKIFRTNFTKQKVRMMYEQIHTRSQTIKENVINKHNEKRVEPPDYNIENPVYKIIPENRDKLQPRYRKEIARRQDVIGYKIWKYKKSSYEKKEEKTPASKSMEKTDKRNCMVIE